MGVVELHCKVGEGGGPFKITKKLGCNRKGFIATRRLLKKVGEGCNSLKMPRQFVEGTGAYFNFIARQVKKMALLILKKNLVQLKRFDCNYETIKVNPQEVLLTGLNPLFYKR